MSFTATLRAMLTAIQTDTGGGGSQKDTLSLNLNDSLADGSSDAQYNVLYHNSLNVNNEQVTVDLFGSVADELGNTVNMAGLKFLMLVNNNTDTGEYVDVGGHANGVALGPNDGDDAFRIHPGGGILLWSPTDNYALQDGSGDVIQFDTTGSGANVSLTYAVGGITG